MMKGFKYAITDSKTVGGMVIWTVIWAFYNALVSGSFSINGAEMSFPPIGPLGHQVGLAAIGGKEMLGKLRGVVSPEPVTLPPTEDPAA